MSTTAGLGSGDYVAVNPIAVSAILAGLASLLALIDSLLLIIPAIGVALAIVALVQIRSSNGTQTGRLLAVGGMLLSIAVAGVVGARTVNAAVAEGKSREAMGLVIDQFNQAVSSGKYEQAYPLFAPRFRERVPMERFVAFFKSLETTATGRLVGATWNGRAQFFEDQTTGNDYAQILMILSLEKAERKPEIGTTFEQTEDGWQIINMGNLFDNQSQTDQP